MMSTKAGQPPRLAFSRNASIVFERLRVPCAGCTRLRTCDARSLADTGGIHASSYLPYQLRRTGRLQALTTTDIAAMGFYAATVRLEALLGAFLRRGIQHEAKWRP